jgi:hypothetical protein
MTDPADVVREALESLRDSGDRPGMYAEGQDALVALEELVAQRNRLKEQVMAVAAAVDAIAATRNPDDCFAAIKNLEATVRFIR